MQTFGTSNHLTMFSLTNRVFVFVIISFLLLLKLQCNAASTVIVVGAGPAGIAASTKLLRNGITNITILEAENRIGGRIYSTKFGDAIVDLGGQWCHGEEDNIVYDLVKDLDLLRPGYPHFNYYYSSGAELYYPFVKEVWDLFIDIYDSEAPVDNISKGEYVTKRYNDTLLEHYGDHPEKLKLAREFLDGFIKYSLSEEGAFSWYDVAANFDYMECEGNQLLDWKGRGYKTILDVLMQKYPNPQKQLPIDDKLLINSEVIAIEWDNKDSGKVVVKAADGSLYSADHLIFTPSLGVLKDNYKTLFHPALPHDKINVIKTLGIDGVFKPLFHFPYIWWGNSSGFIFTWSEEDIKLIPREFPRGPVKNGISWLMNLSGLYIVHPENPNVLSAWYVGEFVPDVEKLPDDLIIDGFMFVLNKFLKHDFPDIPRPDSMIRNNWYSNPHFRGTYSYQTVASRQFGESPEVILSKPLTASNGKQTLFFAGEATHPKYYSAVHGAIESGFREAQRIIDLYK